VRRRDNIGADDQLTGSEFPWWQSFKPEAVAETQYEQILSASKCGDVACLRKLSTEDLTRAAQETYALGWNASPRTYGYGDFYYGPIVDGRSILGLPSVELSKGRFANVCTQRFSIYMVKANCFQVPLMTSVNRYEGFYFTNNTLQTEKDVTMDLQVIFPTATPKFFQSMYKLYPRSDFNSTFFQRVEIFGDFIIKCPTVWLMEAVNRKSQATYKMIFNAGHQQHAATNDFLFDANYDSKLIPSFLWQRMTH
jgi:carboxylesterase type B